MTLKKQPLILTLEAADEIARQLRLRDLGGLVVIDFIDMTPVRHQREVENRMRDAVKPDRARIQLGRISRFGLLEMSRQRLRPSIGETSQGVCPRCNGTGHVRGVESLALSVLRLMEEEAIKDNTQQVQAQVPVPVATYLLNEKRRSVFHVEKHHGVRVLIIPNPNMDTPQYEVVRVRKDETIEEASYLVKVNKSAPEEAVMPKFDKTAVKKDEPLLQGMSAPKKAPVAAKPVVAQEKPASKGLLAKISNWFSALFATEQKQEKPKEKQHSNKKDRNQERRPQRNNRNTQRRNNRHDNRNENRHDKRNENRHENRSAKEKQENGAAQKQNRQSQQTRNQHPKEEKVAERRQRRNSRKKIRTSDANAPVKELEKNLAVEQTSSVENTKSNESVTNTSDKNSRDEQRPRNRRSPRHLRANGQRRRQSNEVKETANFEPVADNAADPVEVRYPETEKVTAPVVSAEVEQASKQEKEQDVTINTEVQQDLPLETVNEDTNEISEVSVEPMVEEATTNELKTNEATTNDAQGDLLAPMNEIIVEDTTNNKKDDIEVRAAEVEPQEKATINGT